MPDREVSYEQSREIIKWATAVKGGAYITNVDTHGEMSGNGIYDIDGEPLVIYGYQLDKRNVLCSDKHARELEAEGIVEDFSQLNKPDFGSPSIGKAIRGVSWIPRMSIREPR